MAHGGDRKNATAKSTVQNEQLKPKSAAVTRQRIADDSGTSESYVMRAGWYAQGIDAAEEVIPGIKQEILTGAIKPPETAVAAVAKAGPGERPQLAAALKTARDGRTQKPDEPQPAYHKAPPIGSGQSDRKKIAEISAEMERPKAPVAEEGMLQSLGGEVDSFTELCDRIFLEYPGFLKHPLDLAHARIYDRILERCAPILFAGKNFREDNAASTKAAARGIVTPKQT